MKMPQVSIIMATYNRAHFIMETLVSIQNQLFTDWECIIVDDGGTDNTAEVIAPVLEKDSRFSYLKRSDIHQKGLPGCRNYGIERAQGDYVIFFDDDDIVHPENLRLCLQQLSDTAIDFCRYKRTTFSGTFDYQFDLKPLTNTFFINGKQDVGKMITGALPFNSCAVMWRKKFLVANRFAEHLMFAEEWECYARILMSGATGISLDKVLFYGRKHPKSNTGEFQSKNPVRIKSKIDAACLIISNLNNNHLLDYTLSKYFVALSKRLQAPLIYEHLIAQPNITNTIKDKIKKRYQYYKMYMLGYKIKNILSS